MTKHLIITTLTLGLACSTLAAEQPSTAMPLPSRPNIVWITAEDMNDWMGCFGDSTVPTPGIDRLAAAGVRFDRAYMTAGVCSASRSAIALGAMQTSLGVHNHRSSRRRTPEEVIHLPEGVKTVYELMREAGYFVTNEGMNKNDFNFIWNSGDLYDLDRKGKANGKAPTRHLWRHRAKGQPFFAQVQLKGGKNSGKFRTAAAKTDPSTVEVMPYYPDIPIIRQEIAHHYNCIRQTDEEVGDVLKALTEDGVLDNTVVFFWTDHGMRLYRHKQWVYDEGVRVPLVVAGPGVKRGTARDDLVSGIDITVSTLAVAGVERPAWMEGRNIFATDYTPRNYVVSARDRCDYTIDRVRAVTTPRYQYIRNFLTDRAFMQPQYRDGRPYIEEPRRLFKEGKLNAAQAAVWSETRTPEELYDLQNDPHEIRNLVDDPAYASELKRHREFLSDWIKNTDDKGQYPESATSLRGVLKRWGRKCVNPEYDTVR
jgi:N-sulfoglucosamine sulfohydrolase